MSHVASQEETSAILQALTPTPFAQGHDGYDSQIAAPSRGFTGLTLDDIHRLLSNDDEASPSITTIQTLILDLRERIRNITETQLGLCPGSLIIEYTHVSQKTMGGQHGPHADNSVVIFDETTGVGYIDDNSSTPNPYPHRVAASIFFLNSRNNNSHWEGGDFYWANMTGDPAMLVAPTAGTMTYFTSGIENLHGALPVVDVSSSSCSGDDDCPVPRRVAIAMWYTLDHMYQEVLPTDPEIVVKLPLAHVKTSSLKILLTLSLMERQNLPTPSTWKLITPKDETTTLGMLYKDQSTMLIVSIQPHEIRFERQATVSTPSLVYQLQESVLCHAILDILEEFALGVPESGNLADRIVQLADPQAVEGARESLPVRPTL